jgi:excisionase family DNA binding protein
MFDNSTIVALPKLLYSRKEAASMLSVSLRTLDRLVSDDKIETVILGGRRLVTRNALLNRGSSSLY